MTAWEILIILLFSAGIVLSGRIRSYADKEHYRRVEASRELVRQERYLSDHPELAPHIQAAIRNGEILTGMTEVEVLTSWGPPVRILRSEDGLTILSQWVYENRPGGRTDLIFNDGILVRWN